MSGILRKKEKRIYLIQTHDWILRALSGSIITHFIPIEWLIWKIYATNSVCMEKNLTITTTATMMMHAQTNQSTTQNWSINSVIIFLHTHTHWLIHSLSINEITFLPVCRRLQYQQHNSRKLLAHRLLGIDLCWRRSVGKSFRTHRRQQLLTFYELLPLVLQKDIRKYTMELSELIKFLH